MGVTFCFTAGGAHDLTVAAGPSRCHAREPRHERRPCSDEIVVHDLGLPHETRKTATAPLMKDVVSHVDQYVEVVEETGVASEGSVYSAAVSQGRLLILGQYDTEKPERYPSSRGGLVRSNPVAKLVDRSTSFPQVPRGWPESPLQVTCSQTSV